MGFNHIWFSCLIDDIEYHKLLSHFEKAEFQAVFSNKSEIAINYWKENPEKFELDYLVTNSQDPETGKYINDFLWSFNLQGYEQLAESLYDQNGILGNFVNEKNVFRFIIVSRNTPVSILWHALGFEKANILPGKMGNLLVHSSEVSETLKKIQSIYNELNSEKLIKKGKAFTGQEASDQEITDILYMLPDGLNEALKQKKGILFIARKQP